MKKHTTSERNTSTTTKMQWIICALILIASTATAQRGYYDAPYVRYEADLGTLINASPTTKSYAQANLQSEASDQICVSMSGAGSSVAWTVSAPGDGLVVRYSIPAGEVGVLAVYANNVIVDTLNLTSYYTWVNLGLPNTNPKKRFDEVRVKMPAKIAAGASLKLAWISGNINIDFAELEPVPAAEIAAPGDFVYTGDGSTLQSTIDANGGKTIFLPAGIYNVNSELYFGVDNTLLKGAGMWYTELHFINTNGGKGGLRSNAANISFSGLNLSTVRNSRNNSYKAINGVFTAGATISNIWAEHFECGSWIGQYNQGAIAYADGFTMSNCRFRNNFADGTNLCKGTRNAVVEHCSYRNNGDDDMAIWSANGLECQNNTFRYNTSENCWRSASCAVYGGLSNKAYNLILKDNLEVGIRVNNSFSGAPFNDNGLHEFHDITIIACGTFNDLFNAAVGAIDIACDNVAGTRVKNVKFSNIDVIDSKNDAIYIYKKAGEGFFNLTLNNITVNGTGREYPGNNIKGLNWGRGYGILYVGNPAGDGTYCNITYAGRGGNAASDINNTQIGSFSFLPDCSPPRTIAMTSGVSFGVCTNPILLNAVATPPLGDSLSSMEFFVDNISIGKKTKGASGIAWSNPAAGSHKVKAVASYAPSNTSSVSYNQNVSIEEGIYATAKAPVIDGYEEAIWDQAKPFSIDLVSAGTINGPADLSASFRVLRDATNLYILVDVADDVLRNDGKYNWQKDGIELYLDMNNDKSGPYISGKGFQYSFVWNINTAQPGLTFAQTTKSTNLGYLMEIMIPWASLNGAPPIGALVGIDVQVEDNDSGTRDGKKAWHDGTDNAWQSTAVLGTLQMAGCKNAFLSVESVNATDDALQLYPNPFVEAGYLKLNSEKGNSYSVTVMDMCGKMLWNKNLPGNAVYPIGEQLLPGMYLLEIVNGLSVKTGKFIKL